MKRNDWVWVFAKMFGIYLFILGFRYIPAIVQYLMATSDQSPLFESAFVSYLLTLILVVAAGLFLMLRTGWVLWFVGIQYEKDKESKASGKEVEETAWSSLDGRKSMLWIIIKAMGVYFAFLAIIRIPISINKLAIIISSGEERYSLLEDRLFSEAVTEYIQLGIGVSLIIFTGFFVRLVTRYGLLSLVKEKLKHVGGIE